MLTKDKSFYRTFLSLMLALMMQQAVVLSVNLADNVMLALNADQGLNCITSAVHCNSYKWIRRLTREQSA